MRSLLVPLLAAVPAAASPAGDVSLLVGPPGGPRDVRVTDEAGLAPVEAPAGLQGIVLLELDFVGRTTLQTLLPDRPRRRTDLPGAAARLVLPGGQGSLYRFRRDEAGGGATFGLFVVGPDGAARVVLEVPGAGPAGTDDPLLPRVGVATAGDAVLAATTVAAGGDLLEVHLATGVVLDRTAALAPLALEPGSLRLLATWGAAVADAGVLRFDRADPLAQAALVPVPGLSGPPSHLGGDVVASVDELVCATTLGSSPTQAFVVAFGPAGDADVVTTAPATVSDASFLPDGGDGPTLALSADGSWCAWRTTEPKPGGGTTHEAWLGRTDLPTAGEQVSADSKFADTFDEVGDFLFQGIDSLVLGVGEVADAAGGIDSMDFYRVSASTSGASTYENVSLTSGDGLAPFLGEGELETDEWLQLTPEGTRALGVMTTHGDGSLVAVDLVAGGTTTLLAGVDSVAWAEAVGDRVVLSLLRDFGAKPRQLVQVPADLSGPVTVLTSQPASMQLVRPAPLPGGWLALVASSFGNEWVARVHPASGAIELPIALPLGYGPTLGATPAGGLALTVGAPFGATDWHVTWSPAGALALLPTSPAPAVVLPGP